MAIHPLAPKNSASFLLGKSVRVIFKEQKFISLVTYADESQKHSGGVYLASGWKYVGETQKESQWIDPRTGKFVARKAGPKTRTKEEMINLGFEMIGRFSKKKFVLHSSDRAL